MTVILPKEKEKFTKFFLLSFLLIMQRFIHDHVPTEYYPQSGG